MRSTWRDPISIRVVRTVDIVQTDRAQRFGRSRSESSSLTMSSATASGGSCSQYRRTVQPRSLKIPSVRRSRALFTSSFWAHHAAFAAGRVACSGQPCQKQPSMNIASLSPRHAMSARVRKSGSTLTSVRKRTPREWSARRTCVSGAVSLLRCRLIRARTDSDDARGRSPRGPCASSDGMWAV